MTHPDEHFHWGKLVVRCLEVLRDQPGLPVRFVDFEVLPPFDGAPDNIFVWFICGQRTEAESFRCSCLDDATTLLRAALLREAFPEGAASSLRTGVTSLEEIEAGGGRFYYFR